MQKYIMILEFQAADDAAAWDISTEIEDHLYYDPRKVAPVSHGLYLANDQFKVQGDDVPA